MTQSSDELEVALREADELLREYSQLSREIQDIRRDALKLYTTVMKKKEHAQVAEALGRILEIPE